MPTPVSYCYNTKSIMKTTNNTNHTGTLYLIPMPLGLTADPETVPEATQKIITSLDTFLAENPKTARAYLKKFQLSRPIQEITILPIKLHTQESEVHEIITILKTGESVGILSEAGCPCVADPGSLFVKTSHEHGITVTALVGPSSILLALMALGLNGQRFTFTAYLPVERNARSIEISEIGKTVESTGITHIIMETPYRADYVLRDLIEYLPPYLIITIAVDLTTPNENVVSKTVSDWKDLEELPQLDNRQTIFVIGKDSIGKNPCSGNVKKRMNNRGYQPRSSDSRKLLSHRTGRGIGRRQHWR